MSSKKNKTQKKINKKKVFIALTICILVALIGGVSVLAYGVYKDTETLFPESATTTMYANEELESTENIHYQWNEKGALLFSKQESYAADGTLEVSVVTNYSKTVPLAPVLARTDAQSYVTEIAYSYDDNGWLKSAIRNLPATDNPENTPKELYEYEETDAQGNWTKSIQKQSEQIDLSHWSGTFYVQRTISYHSGL